MTLPLVILIAMAGLFILGEVWPSYPATTKTGFEQPIDTLHSLVDLRVSEFAPDLNAARLAEYNWVMLTDVRSAAQKTHREKVEHIKNKMLEKERQDKLLESQHRSNEVRDRIYRDYYDKIQEIKTRRWKEGNPVTKKNPIDPDEMPPKPYNHF